MEVTHLQFVLRWLHVIAGIAWIGHLYFFNFVNIQLQASIDDPTKKAVNPQLMPRALWWFRWGAMITFLSGLVLFTLIYMHNPGQGFGANDTFRDETGTTDRALWILLGMLLGTVMWFNVWFVIWPAQKALLSGKVPPDQVPAVRSRAGLFSRINTYLSAPMLFCMLAPNHFYGPFSLPAVLVVAVIGLGSIWAAYFHSSRVGKKV